MEIMKEKYKVLFISDLNFEQNYKKYVIQHIFRESTHF